MSRGIAGAARIVAPYASVLLLACALIARWEPVAVAGGSMRPALEPGDLVFVRRDAVPRVGDIALVEAGPGVRYLHRVRRVAPGGGLVMRGDANDIADRRVVPLASVSGVVHAVLPVGGWIAALRRSV